MNTTEQIIKAKTSAPLLVKVSNETNRKVLLDLAERAETNANNLISANKLDLDRMDETDPRFDRLLLTKERISGIAHDLRKVAMMDSPLGEILEEKELQNGLKLKKIRVPLGVVGVIYEARPNVTFDVFALCFRTGNAVVLKGGLDAWFSNQAITSLIHKSLIENGVSPDILQMLPPEREAAQVLMNAAGLVDVLIPRGSQSLINSVRENAKVAVIETGAGVVHTYFDESADLELSKKVIFNAKTRRVSVCNALECLIINYQRLYQLPDLVAPLAAKSVKIEADGDSYKVLSGNYPSKLLSKANDNSFGKEFLDYRMAIKTVDNIDQALSHISTYGTKHSEAILSTDKNNIQRFYNEVDAAAVYCNTSTAFTDGAQFDMGAEIGISTQKLHARGPMGLKELTSYKWLINSDGLTRP